MQQLNQPLLSTTLIMPDDEYSLSDPYDIKQQLNKQVDIIVDSGYGNVNLTTIIDMTSDSAEVIRQGQGVYGSITQ